MKKWSMKKGIMGDLDRCAGASFICSCQPPVHSSAFSNDTVIDLNWPGQEYLQKYNANHDVIMEAEMFHDLPSACWRPVQVCGKILVQTQSTESKESQV